MKQEITGKLEEIVHGAKDETIEGHFLEKVTTGGKEQKITGLHDVTITGDRKETVTGDLKQTVTGGVTQTVTGDVKVFAKSATYVIAGEDVKIAPKKIVDMSAYKLALVGLDAAIIGLVTKAYVSKNEYHGFKVDVTSVRYQNTPISFGQFMAKVDQAMTAYGQAMIDAGMVGMWMRM
jgi:type VI secretion system secreted protein VgrG